MKGSQKPTFCVEPKRAGSYGPDAAMLMAEYGSRLDPWQETVTDCWLGVDEEGRYTTTSAGLATPRQNGKNICIEAREFYGLTIRAEKILHTAHQVKTAKNSFWRLAQMFTDKRHPEVTEEVKQIRYANGEEAIELHNGGVIKFSARSRQSSRGIDGISLIVFDEAQELTDDQLEAIMAVLAASSTGTRQIIYAGTPPYPGCPGTVFRRRRKICIESPGEHDAWHQWEVKAKSIDEIDVTDRKLWLMTNPSLGVYLTEEFTEEEMRTMTKDGFARERLGWWPPELEKETDTAINADAWEKCGSDALKPEGKTAYGVKFSADGSEVSLCGAVCPEEGQARISFIIKKTTEHGIAWLADWLNPRYNQASCVVIDGKNNVDLLIDRISGTWKAKGSIVRASSNTVIAAASLLVTEISEGSVTWYRKQETMDESARTAVKRRIGGGWGLGGPDPTPIEASAHALWGARNSKRDPKRKMRIV